jgi:hypothetical protein
MYDTHTTIDRLEARIEHQAARIDALYLILEDRGILPRHPDAGKSDAFLDEDVEFADAPSTRETRVRRARPPATRLRVGNATGV